MEKSILKFYGIPVYIIIQIECSDKTVDLVSVYKQIEMLKVGIM